MVILRRAVRPPGLCPAWSLSAHVLGGHRHPRSGRSRRGPVVLEAPEAGPRPAGGGGSLQNPAHIGANAAKKPGATS